MSFALVAEAHFREGDPLVLLAPNPLWFDFQIRNLVLHFDYLSLILVLPLSAAQLNNQGASHDDDYLLPFFNCPKS